MTLAITNALVLAGWEVEPREGVVLIEGERILAIAQGDDAAALAARAGERFDAGGAIVMPAFVNAHHHAYSNALRGTENAQPLELWALFTVAWGRALDGDLLRLAILLGAAEMLRGGVASVIDHSPQVRLHETAFAAHAESGMRVGYAPMLHDLHDHDLLGFTLPAPLRARIEGAGFPSHGFYADMIAALVAAAGGSSRVRILIGPNAPQRCSPELLTLWAGLRARHGLGVHTHLLETRAQAIQARRAWRDGIVAEMDRRGLLTPGLAVAHGVWASEAERALLAARGVVVVHNPSSNLMLGSGVMPYAGYAVHGATIALGSDSANTGGAADPFELMRLAMMLPRVHQDPVAGFKPSSVEVLRMATQGGARALGLGDQLGRIAPGQLADLAVIDLSDAAAIAMAPTRDVLVQHGGPARVRATMVGGRWAWRDGRILAFDESAVLAAFRDSAADLAHRAADECRIARAAACVFTPQLRALYAANAEIASPG